MKFDHPVDETTRKRHSRQRIPIINMMKKYNIVTVYQRSVANAHERTDDQ